MGTAVRNLVPEKFRIYRGPRKSMSILLSNSQAAHLSKRRKKFLATTYKLFPGALYVSKIAI